MPDNADLARDHHDGPSSFGKRIEAAARCGEGRRQIDVDHMLPLRHRGLGCASVIEDPRAMDETVEPPQCRDPGTDRLDDVPCFRHVAAGYRSLWEPCGEAACFRVVTKRAHGIAHLLQGRRGESSVRSRRRRP